MPGPFDAPEGTTPETYLVTIQAVVPFVNTDPATWELHALLDLVGGSEQQLQVESVVLRPRAGGAK